MPLDFETLTDTLENGLVAQIQGVKVELNSFADICEELEGLTSLELQDAVLSIL